MPSVTVKLISVRKHTSLLGLPGDLQENEGTRLTDIIIPLPIPVLEKVYLRSQKEDLINFQVSEF